MAFISASDDTWGISGPDFLVAYLGAAAVFLIAGIALRLSATRSGADHVVRQPSHSELAYLAAGPTRAVFSSLAGLRAVGAVGSAGQGRLTQTGPAPAGMNELDAAVFDAAGRGVATRELAGDWRVSAALTQVGSAVDRAGWVTGEAARARARLGGLLLLALSVFGVVRIIAGAGAGKPVGYLVVATIVLTLVSIRLLFVPRLTTAGKAAMAHAHVHNRHLAPSQSPAWATYGLSGAAMGVALYGTTALWAADPAFAEEAGIQREAASASSVGGGDGGGDGGGSAGGDGGGGGGCGGGGCGG